MLRFPWQRRPRWGDAPVPHGRWSDRQPRPCAACRYRAAPPECQRRGRRGAIGPRVYCTAVCHGPRGLRTDVTRLCERGHATQSAAGAGQEATATATATACRNGHPALVMAAAAAAASASVRPSNHAVSIFLSDNDRSYSASKSDVLARPSAARPYAFGATPSVRHAHPRMPRGRIRVPHTQIVANLPFAGRRTARIASRRPCQAPNAGIWRRGRAARRRSPLLLARHPDEPRAGAAQGRPLAAALDPLLVAL